MAFHRKFLILPILLMASNLPISGINAQDNSKNGSTTGLKEIKPISLNTYSPKTGAILQYCLSTYTDTTDDWITNVNFNTINNSTGQEGIDSYGDYSTIFTSVIINQTYPLSVSFYSHGVWTQHVRVWIDWDQDELFEADESYYLGSGVDATLTINITIPPEAIPGSTRLRVIEQWGEDPGGNGACNSQGNHGDTFGETEDYTIIIPDGIAPGFLAGVVTDSQMNPINGAMVTVSFFTDTVGIDGIYFFELFPSVYSATASAEYHDSVAIDSIVITPDDTTIQDFILPTPLIYIDTSSIQLNVDTGDVVMVTRNLSNIGDGVLRFIAEIDVGESILSVRQHNGVSNLNRNTADEKGHPRFNKGNLTHSQNRNLGDLPVILNFGDVVFVFDPETPTGDPRCLGVEFDGSHFWVTGAGTGSGDLNRIHKFDINGVYLESFLQNTSSNWGWRDLVWDGEYLYASDDSQIDIFDPVSGTIVGSFNGPENPNRALAYDPIRDHFWTANFSSNIYEFDRNGNTINIFPNTQGLSIYGMAWDNASIDGPWLWTFSQDGSPQLRISQFDPINGQFTGVSFQGDDYNAIAGGCAFTTEWNPELGIFFGLQQGDPSYVKGYEITPFHRPWINVAPIYGILPPAESINLTFTVDFTGDDIIPNSIYTADIYILNNTPLTPVIPVMVTSGDLLYDSVIRGIVSDTAAIPIYGVYVSIEGIEIADTTDTLGQYNLDSLVAGNFDIIFSHPDYQDTAITDVFVAASDTIDLNITLLFQQCIYVTGDINGSDSYNDLDIIYGVNFFKGGSDPMCAFGSCPIPPCDAFFYCGDVNGSCSYNGLDITYGVNYFKGGSEPIPCEDCPPVGVENIIFKYDPD